MPRLSSQNEQRLAELGRQLIDQEAAVTIVPAQQAASGFWFGGGNMIEFNDALYLAGRFRNHGDSRTGVAAGQRGLQLSIFRSTDQGTTFEECLAFSKQELDQKSRPVLSIEGCALRKHGDEVELFVSTEKDGIGYPAGLADYLKPGTGVWTIERYRAKLIEELKAAPAETVVAGDDPGCWHVKDPAVYQGRGADQLIYCTHPYSWSSSNSAIAAIGPDGRIGPSNTEFFGRGKTWDVAMSRVTAAVDVPSVGPFAEHSVTLVFYDGGECLRDHDEHQQALRRPRGYSCEELGGLAYCVDNDWEHCYRISSLLPMFVSPFGTGCSRYVDVLATADQWFVSWQQAQSDGSQPLVMHRIATSEVHAILEGRPPTP